MAHSMLDANYDKEFEGKTIATNIGYKI